MRIAVTGAGGLLGRAVARRLIESGDEVVALSSSINAINDIKVVAWNALQDWRLTAKNLDCVDAIIHVGAHIPVDHNCADEALKCFEVNAYGTLNLLRASELAGVGRFIYISGANILTPRMAFVQEDDPVDCSYSPFYLGSKVLGEIYVRSKIVRGLNGLIVRPSTIYGPGMTKGALWGFAEKIKNKTPIILQDGGRFRSDYVWRDDVARVLCEAVHNNRTGDVNLGSGEAKSILDVAILILKILNGDKSLIKFSAIQNKGYISGFSPVNIERARRWFNFEPVMLQEGLTRWIGKGEL